MQVPGMAARFDQWTTNACKAPHKGVNTKKHGRIEELFDDSCVFVSRGRQVTDEPGMKEHTIELRHPCKECLGNNAKGQRNVDYEVVAEGTLYVVSRRFVEKCVALGDFAALAEKFDEYFHSTYDWMHCCTNLEGGPDMPDQYYMTLEPEDEHIESAAAFVEVHGIYRGFPSIPGVDEMKGCVLVDDLCLTQKKWAGHGYGAFLLNTALKKLMPAGSIGPVYLKPYPLQWNRGQKSSYRQVFPGEDPAGPDSEFIEEQLGKIESDTCKLIKSYRSCGFSVVPGSDIDDEPPYLMRRAVPSVDVKLLMASAPATKTISSKKYVPESKIKLVKKKGK